MGLHNKAPFIQNKVGGAHLCPDAVVHYVRNEVLNSNENVKKVMLVDITYMG